MSNSVTLTNSVINSVENKEEVIMSTNTKVTNSVVEDKIVFKYEDEKDNNENVKNLFSSLVENFGEEVANKIKKETKGNFNFIEFVETRDNEIQISLWNSETPEDWVFNLSGELLTIFNEDLGEYVYVKKEKKSEMDSGTEVTNSVVEDNKKVPKKVYTTYFAVAKNLKDKSNVHSIAFYNPKELPDLPKIPALIPSWNIIKKYKNDGDEATYTEEFNKQLENVPLSIIPDGAILCCYEGKEKFCHRHLVAKWLCSKGVDCHELTPLDGFEMNKADKPEQIRQPKTKNIEKEKKIMKKETKFLTPKEVKENVKKVKLAFSVKVEEAKGILLKEKNVLAEICQNEKIDIARAMQKIANAVSKEEVEIEKDKLSMIRAKFDVAKTKKQINVAKASSDVAKIKLEMLEAVIKAKNMNEIEKEIPTVKDEPKISEDISEEKKPEPEVPENIPEPENSEEKSEPEISEGKSESEVSNNVEEEESSEPEIIPNKEVQKAVSDDNSIVIDDIHSDAVVDNALKKAKDSDATIKISASVADTQRVIPVITMAVKHGVKNFRVTWNKKNLATNWKKFVNKILTFGVKVEEVVGDSNVVICPEH